MIGAVDEFTPTLQTIQLSLNQETGSHGIFSFLYIRFHTSSLKLQDASALRHAQ